MSIVGGPMEEIASPTIQLSQRDLTVPNQPARLLIIIPSHQLSVFREIGTHP